MGHFYTKAFPSPGFLRSGSPAWDRLLHPQRPSPTPPRTEKLSPVPTRGVGMPSQATAFLLFLLSKLAVPPPVSALWFFVCKSTVSKTIVFEVTAKGLGDERDPRNGELSEQTGTLLRMELPFSGPKLLPASSQGLESPWP